MKIEECKESVDKFFADTRRSQAETKEDLRELIDHIRELISTLEE